MIKTLTHVFAAHGNVLPADPSQSDLESLLSPHGEVQADAMGHVLKMQIPVPNYIFSSSAMRCLQSAQNISHAWGESAPGVVALNQLYYGHTEDSVPEQVEAIKLMFEGNGDSTPGLGYAPLRSYVELYSSTEPFRQLEHWATDAITTVNRSQKKVAEQDKTRTVIVLSHRLCIQAMIAQALYKMHRVTNYNVDPMVEMLLDCVLNEAGALILTQEFEFTQSGRTPTALKDVSLIHIPNPLPLAPNPIVL
jgi:broad specificity phosphatase PhoE